MKSIGLPQLRQMVEASPEDWSLRLRLVEGHVLEGDMDSARQLVRESPDDVPLPPELQFRLHSVLTQGATAVERFYADEEGRGFPFLSGQSVENSKAATDLKPEEAGASIDPESLDERSAPEAVLPPEGPAAKSSTPGPVPAGASGSEETPARKGRAPATAHVGGPLPGLTDASGRMAKPQPEERELPERFVFSELDELDADPLLTHERGSQAGQKISAFTTAIAVHIAVVVICGFIAIGIPLREPPKIIAVNVNAERVPEIAPRLVERNVPKAASASAQPTTVISTVAQSTFSVPEFDAEATPDVTLLMTGIDAGQGMSFSGEGQESNVNFFGIRAGGKRVAFIIDATRYMLVDEKGGMFAYDKVKAEVAAMLGLLNRGTAFNIILYEGKRLSVFREEPVAAKPSNVRLASEWLDGLNRDYVALGLGNWPASDRQTSEGIGIVEPRDTTGYMKAIQVALEMDVNTVFAICSGYQRIGRSLTPEQMAEARRMNEGRTPGEVDPKDRQRWQDAQEETREWLRKENEARAEQGLAPKVVINFTALVREVTGETPPRASGGSPAPEGMPRPGPPYTPEELEEHLEEVVVHFYRDNNKAVPEVHMVLFLGEDEDIGDQKDHFRRLTRQHKGKLKILEGLAALTDVTSK